MEQQDRYVNDVEAAKMLSASPQTLRNWRCQRRGPVYSKRGKMIRYRVQDLLDFMNAGRINPQESEVSGTPASKAERIAPAGAPVGPEKQGTTPASKRG